MSKPSKEARAGVPGRFDFDGKTYRVAPASAAQYYELNEILRRHARHPVVEAAGLLKQIGDALTPDERKQLLADAQAEARPRYVTKVKVAWDEKDTDLVTNLVSDDEAGFIANDAITLGMPPSATVGDAARLAWKLGARPDDDPAREYTEPALGRLRDALNEHFADHTEEVTEQVGGWPPSQASPEGYMVLYAGPGLPEVLGVLLPRHNEGMSRADAEELGRAMLADPSGKGLESFNKAFDRREDDPSEGDEDKSGD